MISVIDKIMGNDNATVGYLFIYFCPHFVAGTAKFQIEVNGNIDVFFSSPGSLIFWITSVYPKSRIPVVWVPLRS